MSAAALVLPTVNAPYAVRLDASALAACLTDLVAATEAAGPVYAFFSEVDPGLQQAFLAEMGVSVANVTPVAAHFARLSGVPLHLAG